MSNNNSKPKINPNPSPKPLPDLGGKGYEGFNKGLPSFQNPPPPPPPKPKS